MRGGFAALAVVSAASYSGDFVLAPASIASGFGDLAALAKGAGPSVTMIDGAGASHSAQVLAAAPVQVNFVTPAEAAVGVATVMLSVEGRQIAAGVVRLENVAPGLSPATRAARV